MEADDAPYAVAAGQVAARLGVSTAEVAADPAKVTAGPRARCNSRGVGRPQPPFRACRTDGGPARCLACRPGEESIRDEPCHHHEGSAAGRDEPRGHPEVRSHFHHHAREQADVRDQEFAARAADQRVPGRRQPVHQLLLHRQSERAEPHRRRRAATTSASRTTISGTACPRETPRTCRRTRCRRAARRASTRRITTSSTKPICSRRSRPPA